jgi:hypothetical protein
MGADEEGDETAPPSRVPKPDCCCPERIECVQPFTFLRTMSFSSSIERGTRLANPPGPISCVKLCINGELVFMLVETEPRRPPSVITVGLGLSTVVALDMSLGYMGEV